MQAVLDFSVPYLHVREAFGEKIGHFQVSVLTTSHWSHLDRMYHQFSAVNLKKLKYRFLFSIFSWCKERWPTCTRGWAAVGSTSTTWPALVTKDTSAPWCGHTSGFNQTQILSISLFLFTLVASLAYVPSFIHFRLGSTKNFNRTWHGHLLKMSQCMTVWICTYIILRCIQ